MQDPDLDLSHATPDSVLAKAFFELAASKGKTSIADCLCYFYHNKGPAMEIHHLTIEGPSTLVVSPSDLKLRERQFKITGTPDEGQSQENFVRGMLERFLPRAFRKAVTEETIESYLSIAIRHWGRVIATGRHASVSFAIFLFRPASCIAASIPKEWMTSILPPGCPTS